MLEASGIFIRRSLGEQSDRSLERVSGGSDLGVAYHPWWPVLCIGVEKANLYMKAIRGDVVRERRMLTDPAWLLRVGVYLELLTCLGIAEVARDTLDLLSPEERDAATVLRRALVAAREAWAAGERSGDRRLAPGRRRRAVG